jgi:fluoroacetyl-CoA thioesterase
MTNALEPGRSATATLTVSEADTAIALRSGDVPVLGSPRVVALAEEAAVAAVAGSLPADKTSVGVSVELEHNAPSRIGATVTAEATLEVVDGRKLQFTISVRNDSGVEVANLRHRRVVVDRDAFA